MPGKSGFEWQPSLVHTSDEFTQQFTDFTPQLAGAITLLSSMLLAG